MTPKGWRAPKGMIDRSLPNHPKRVARASAQLREWGVAYVLLQRDRAPKADQAQQWLEQVLGPPALTLDETVVFEVPPAERVEEP